MSRRLRLMGAAGNVTIDATTGNQYLYDGEGRICAVSVQTGLGNTTMTQYIYDADGNRVAKGSISAWSCDNSVNLSTGLPNNGFTAASAYVLGPHGERMTEMTNTAAGGQAPAWQWLHTNVMAPGLSATYDADLSGATEGWLYFHLSDWLGTRRQQTDYAGNPCLDFTGLPFGDGLATVPVSSAGCGDATEQHFTGKERDAESGNDYFGKRYYASSMGRWMSPDVINVTDERLLNPANTLNKYAYAANNPLGAIDPDGRDVTFLREQGTSVLGGNPFGHVIVAAYNEKNGQSAVESFGPAKPGDPNQFVPSGTPGQEGFGLQNIQSADQLRQNFSAVTIRTTPEVAQEIVNAIKSANDGNYQAVFNNCTDAAKKVLAAGGISTTRGLPSGQWDDLYTHYSSDSWWKRHTLGAPFQLGHDYGRPRWGMNTFDMMFLLMKPDNSSVTTTETYTINCQKNPGACK
jgi:RHS repeat-associated protein